ncbi:sigma-54 dependent transcriptional regulator [Paraburkholderia sp. IMGN_8]|uniref:sigma-54 dependent transcriptional regulator n=1 Tax=Paraburkholderia sp. IMGN_8 TaxID=3136564 RepID=UPI0031016942
MNKQFYRSLVYVSRSPERGLCDTLGQRGWDVAALRSGREARAHLAARHPTVGVFDFASGFSSHELAGFKSCFATAGIGWVGILAAPQLTNELQRGVIRRYFSRFVTVPYELDSIADAIGHEHGMVVLNAETDALTVRDEIVGTCPAMKDLFRAITKVANSEAPVLISGESGTGKELTAMAIHKRSVRRNGPLVVINCGALPYHLVQSELFGYERGAFTGAFQRKIGRIEAAHGGTLFLDEIGDLPLESQSIVLRFLQDRKIQRLGGTESIDVDVRIIAATNVTLEKAVAEQTFREDLYHRLCVLRIAEPPLRKRGEDIEVLAYHMLEKYRSDASHQIRGFSDEAIKAMYAYSWPGNVRELVNRVRRAIVMSDGRVLGPADLELDYMLSEGNNTLTHVREAAEKRVIEAALRRHRGRSRPAARELDISRATLYRLMANYGGRAHQDSTAASTRTPAVPAACDEEQEEWKERYAKVGNARRKD